MARPKYHILKEYGNGVMDQEGRFWPFKNAVATIAAKNTKRYYISSIWMSASKTGNGAIAATVDKIEATAQGITNVIAQIDMGASIAGTTMGTQCVMTNNNVNLLCDLATPITITIASTGIACVQYAEVDENTGEYQG